MAKAGHLSKESLANFSAQEIKRPHGNLPKRRYYLIVCEGKETEPNYFEAIRRILPPSMVHRVTISGTGRNTLSLVDYAQKLVDKRRKTSFPPYYKIWLVFDRDSFSGCDFDNAIFSINNKCSDAEHWQAAWSNEAFELWYILHFKDQTGGPLSRQQYKAILTKEMGRRYEKNATDMFELLKPHIYKAIQRAEDALSRQSGKPFHEQNPATTVHKLVEELLEYIP